MAFERELEIATKLALSNGFDSVQFFRLSNGLPFFKAALTRFTEKTDVGTYLISVDGNSARFLDLKEAYYLINN